MSVAIDVEKKVAVGLTVCGLTDSGNVVEDDGCGKGIGLHDFGDLVEIV